MPKQLKLTEFAERIGVDERTVRKWISAGRLPNCPRRGNGYYVPEYYIERVAEGELPLVFQRQPQLTNT
jgi:predicted site-specific integrase-resolvase